MGFIKGGGNRILNEPLHFGNMLPHEYILYFKVGRPMAGSPYTSAEYNYDNAFRNLVCNVSRRKLSSHSLWEFNI